MHFDFTPILTQVLLLVAAFVSTQIATRVIPAGFDLLKHQTQSIKLVAARDLAVTLVRAFLTAETSDAAVIAEKARVHVLLVAHYPSLEPLADSMIDSAVARVRLELTDPFFGMPAAASTVTPAAPPVSASAPPAPAASALPTV